MIYAWCEAKLPQFLSEYYWAFMFNIEKKLNSWYLVFEESSVNKIILFFSKMLSWIRVGMGQWFLYWSELCIKHNECNKRVFYYSCKPAGKQSQRVLKYSSCYKNKSVTHLITYLSDTPIYFKKQLCGYLVSKSIFYLFLWSVLINRSNITFN